MYKMDQKQYLHEVGQNLADLFYNQKNINMKQTAVEWLEDQYIKHSGNLLEMGKSFEQAKEMEKMQHQETFNQERMAKIFKKSLLLKGCGSSRYLSLNKLNSSNFLLPFFPVEWSISRIKFL